LPCGEPFCSALDDDARKHLTDNIAGWTNFLHSGIHSRTSYCKLYLCRRGLWTNDSQQGERYHSRVQEKLPTYRSSSAIASSNCPGTRTPYLPLLILVEALNQLANVCTTNGELGTWLLHFKLIVFTRPVVCFFLLPLMDLSPFLGALGTRRMVRFPEVVECSTTGRESKLPCSSCLC
jgi:hypothetical protein